MSTVAEMADIRKIEAEAAGPHDLGCFEEYADIAAETLGIDGDYDEILDDGRTLMAHFHTDVTNDPTRCTCRVYEIEE
jgi:hypothetical protein